MGPGIAEELTLYIGQDWCPRILLTLVDIDTKVETVENILGSAARMQIRKKSFSTTIIANLSTEAGGGLTLVPAEGRIDISIADAATRNYIPGRYEYDIWLDDPLGDGSVKSTPIVKGTILVKESVTRTEVQL